MGGILNTDPLRFASLVGFTPDPKQALLLADDHRRLVVNCTRQWGKTTTVAVKAAYLASTHPGALVLVASPSQRQSTNFLDAATRFIGEISPDFSRNRHALRLPNNSALIALPEMPRTIRGFTASLLVIDEAALVSDEMIQALRPTLAATNGPLWMLSTPGPNGGAFYNAWHDESGRWHRISVPATDCPRIRPEFLEEEREALGDRAFRREYMCEFSDDDTAVFPRELIRSAFDPDVPPLFPRGPQ